MGRYVLLLKQGDGVYVKFLEISARLQDQEVLVSVILMRTVSLQLVPTIIKLSSLIDD